MLAAALCVGVAQAGGTNTPSVFDASIGVAGSVKMPTGEIVDYTAYTNLFYVANVEDSVYQTLNVFVPKSATQSSPIFMRNYVGGYMASEAGDINPADASGRALLEGYVVVIPGARGRNSTVTDRKGQKIYTGRAPAGILDLKAAVRYLRHYDKEMPGDAEKIISDGTSAGGAMSALLGATGNNKDYEPYLKAMGAFDERDDVFAAVCYCPITDLDHADREYEWLYACTDNVSRKLTDAQYKVSTELAALCPQYINSLGLTKPDGTALNAENYLDYIKSLLIESAQEAKDAGATIPDSIGFSFSASGMPMARGAKLVKGGMPEGMMPPAGMMPSAGMDGAPKLPMRKEQGEYLTALDMDKYLNYVASVSGLKTPPAFDRLGVADGEATGENEEFGNDRGSSVNFTDYSLQQHTGNPNAKVSKEIEHLVRLMNPMYYIGDNTTTTSKYWYIRHGSKDTDTSFLVPINLAAKLENVGKDVNFKLAWNRPHSGDYALNELFNWIDTITK